MSPRRPRSRSLSGFAVAAAFTLVLGVLTGASAVSATAADEVPISPAVDRIVVVDTTVRAEPSHDAAAVASLEAGDQVPVSAQMPAWRKVTVEGVEGWVPYSVTQEVPRPLEKKVPRELGVDVTLRAQPSDKAAEVAPVLAHSYVTAAAVAGTWRKISTANGAGWVPASALESVTTAPRGYVATKTLNVRATASGSADVVHVLDKRDKVQVLGTRGEWSSVKWGSAAAPAVSYSGWTATASLLRTDIRVTTTSVNLRTKPWTGSVITVIPEGAQVLLTGNAVIDTSRTPKKWSQVTYGDVKGWVATTYLKWPF